MNDPTSVSRRRLLTGGIGVGVLLATGAAWPAVATAQPGTWSSATTANGWPAIAPPAPIRVEGSSLAVAVLPGPVATVLLHCVRRYFYEIDDTLEQGDLVGHTTERRVAAAYESNHLSGTAVAIRPTWHPIGATDGFVTRDVVVVRDILADCEGVVRWGRDEKLVKESHFQIDVGPDDRRLQQVAARIDGWARTAGRGAGSAVDPFAADRRRVAATLEDKQRR